MGRCGCCCHVHCCNRPMPSTGAEPELHFQYGNLAVPTFAGGGNAYHLIYTVQHASGWKYGDNYFFVDTLDAQNSEFQDFDTYGEWYANLSLGKITGRKIGAGIVSDVGVILASTGPASPASKSTSPACVCPWTLADSRSPISTSRRILTTAKACPPEVRRAKATHS